MRKCAYKLLQYNFLSIYPVAHYGALKVRQTIMSNFISFILIYDMVNSFISLSDSLIDLNFFTCLLNPLTTKLFNWNSHSLEVVSR